MATSLDIPLTAYPTLSQAAKLLGVSPSTLSRRSDVVPEAMGARDKRLPATEVLRLAAIYRKRSINEVALDLIEYAREHASAYVPEIEREVERFFALLPPPSVERDFLADAKAVLPEAVYREVEHAYRASGSRPAASVVAVEQGPTER
jgi:DNA-binding Lrp family transcriptional regulator